MAINSIGNLTYINQASPTASSLQASNMAHHMPLNGDTFARHLEKIREARPAENVDRVGHDHKEGGGRHRDRESRRKSRQDVLTTENDMLLKPEYRVLDIRG